MHLAGFLPFVHCDQVLGIIRLNAYVDHFDVGVLHGGDQFRVLADFGPDLADHVHAIGMTLPAL